MKRVRNKRSWILFGAVASTIVVAALLFALTQIEGAPEDAQLEISAHFTDPDPRQRFIDASTNNPGGFGGWTYNPEFGRGDEVLVYMEDLDVDPRPALEDVYLRELPDTITAIQGYSYSQLASWANAIEATSTITLTSSYIDIPGNQIIYGVEAPTDIPKVFDLITEFGIPTSAVEVNTWNPTSVGGGWEFAQLLKMQQRVTRANFANFVYVMFTRSSIDREEGHLDYYVRTEAEVEPAVNWLLTLGIPGTAFHVETGGFGILE